jgi:ketosteroid isomerase-like protein
VSADNLELVHRKLGFEGDVEHLFAVAGPEEVRRTAAEFWDANADYYPAPKFPEAKPCHGLEEISDFLVRFRETWSRFQWEVQEVTDIGDERALAHLTLHAEGRESGMNLEGDVYQCLWLRHGRLLRVEDHLTLKGALHALGFEADTLEAAGLRAPSNLDLVRSIFEAWERGDVSSAEWADPEIEFVLADGPAPGIATGLSAMADSMRDFLQLWEEWSVQADDYLELDDERILVLNRYKARGKTSGLELGQIGAHGANLFQIRGGRVIRLACYLDREQALADVGLSPESASSTP